MSINKKVISVIIAAAVSLSILSGCNDRQEDIEQIRALPQAYLDALSELDADALSSIVPEFEDLVGSDYTGSRSYSVTKYMYSRIEIVEMDEPVFDDNGDARMDVTFSYLSLKDFIADPPEDLNDLYMTADQAIEALEEYDATEETTIGLRFEYDEDDECWYMASGSANKINKLIDSYWFMVITIVDVDPDETAQIYMNYLESIASGDNELVMDINEFRAYDYITDTPCEGPKSIEAVRNFASAYMSYILEHDYTIENSGPYTFYLEGLAPSSEELCELLMTEEYIVEFDAIILRFMYLDMSLDEMMDEETALIYNTLAEGIPDLDSESINFGGGMSPFEGSEPNIYGSPVNTPDQDAYEALCNSQSERIQSTTRYEELAAQQLLDNGEITEEQYEDIIEDVQDHFTILEP